MVQPYTLRPLTPADQALLYEMLYQAIFVPEGEAPPPREIVYTPPVCHYADAYGRPGDVGFAAVDDETGQPVGAAWIRLLRPDEHGYAFVDAATPELAIALLPAYRGLGIGTALMERLLTAAQAQYRAVALSVWPANPAYRLYQRLGFETLRQDGPAVTMVRRLTGQKNS